MTENDDLAPDLEPVDDAVGRRLEVDRPTPGPGFRGPLRRHLAALDPGYGPRQENLRIMVAGLVSVGLLVMLLGVLVSGRIV